MNWFGLKICSGMLRWLWESGRLSYMWVTHECVEVEVAQVFFFVPKLHKKGLGV